MLNRVAIKEELAFAFRRKGLTGLGPVVEVLLEDFLSFVPDQNRKLSKKETLRLVEEYLRKRKPKTKQEKQEERQHQKRPVEPKQEEKPKPSSGLNLTAEQALKLVKSWAVELGADPEALGID